MTEPKQSTSSSPLSTELDKLLSKEERKHIDKYTIGMRRGKERPGAELPLRTRLRRMVEGVHRRFWYRLFRTFFNNTEVTARIPIENVRSIFILPFGDAIGDMLLAIPLFHAIKRRNPDCRLGTFYSSRNKALIRCDSAIDDLFEFHNKSDFRHYSELRSVREKHYDVVINMHMNHMTEFGIISNIISPSGIKVCTSHARNELYQTLFNKLLPFDRSSMHLSQFGLSMLESVIDFGTPIEQWEAHPKIVISPEIQEGVGIRIRDELARLDADWYIHFNPQARNPTREWGLDNAFAYAQQFVEHYPRGAIFFTASPAMRGPVEERIKNLKLERTTFFSTSYDLLELAELSNRSELVITPDTAGIHFGTASGKPTLVLWPDRERIPLEWIPLQVPSINLAPDVRGALVPTISVETVWAATKMLLDKAWTSTATSVGLIPEADPLYQASNAHKPLASLIECSALPRVFVPGSRHSVPLSSLRGQKAVVQ